MLDFASLTEPHRPFETRHAGSPTSKHAISESKTLAQKPLTLTSAKHSSSSASSKDGTPLLFLKILPSILCRYGRKSDCTLWNISWPSGSLWLDRILHSSLCIIVVIDLLTFAQTSFIGVYGGSSSGTSSYTVNTVKLLDPTPRSYRDGGYTTALHELGTSPSMVAQRHFPIVLIDTMPQIHQRQNFPCSKIIISTMNG